MKVLIVEDDKSLSDMLKRGLEAQSYAVDIASDGGEGSFMGKSYEYSVILLDYSLPKKDGLAVCRDIRAAGKTTPIIFLSINDATETKVAALNSGADDYLVKPFSFEELQARLRALNRRPHTTKKQILTLGDIILDIDSHTVTRAGYKIPLTRKEFGVLEYLMQHQGTVVSRVLIMEYVWTADTDLLSNTVETHISNVRKKLGVSNGPDYITNIPGRGYVISPP